MNFDKILVAVDGSELALRAVAVGSTLAQAMGAELVFVHVVDPAGAIGMDGGLGESEMLEVLRDEGRNILDTAAGKASARPSSLRLQREGQPAAEICASAFEYGADVIVVGTHGRSGLARLVMGSTAEEVIRQSSCPVLVVPQPQA